MQQIKREIDEGRRRNPMSLQASEIGRSVRPYGAEFAVEISLPAFEGGKRRGDRRVLVRPVEPVRVSSIARFAAIRACMR